MLRSVSVVMGLILIQLNTVRLVNSIKCSPQDPALQLIQTEIDYNQVKFVPECIIGNHGTETLPTLFRFGNYESESSSRSAANISYACYRDDGEKVLSDADSSIISNSVRSSLTTIVENDNLLFYGLYCEFMGCFEGSGSGQRYLLPQTNCSTFLTRDECKSSLLNDCHSDATCTNIQNGTYTCECNLPLVGNGRTCEEVTNYCLDSNTNNCHSNATCIDHRNGTYSCKCDYPFTGNGTYCEVSNDCLDSNTNDCHSNATCNDHKNGTYSCKCDYPFTGNGTYCEDINHIEPHKTPIKSKRQ